MNECRHFSIREPSTEQETNFCGEQKNWSHMHSIKSISYLWRWLNETRTDGCWHVCSKHTQSVGTLSLSHSNNGLPKTITRVSPRRPCDCLFLHLFILSSQHLVVPSLKARNNVYMAWPSPLWLSSSTVTFSRLFPYFFLLARSLARCVVILEPNMVRNFAVTNNRRSRLHIRWIGSSIQLQPQRHNIPSSIYRIQKRSLHSKNIYLISNHVYTYFHCVEARSYLADTGTRKE